MSEKQKLTEEQTNELLESLEYSDKDEADAKSMRDMTHKKKLKVMSRFDVEQADIFTDLLVEGTKYGYDFFVNDANEKIELYNSVDGWKAELMSKTIGVIRKEKGIGGFISRLFRRGKTEDEEREV